MLHHPYTEADVLLGNKKECRDNQGNVMLRQLVETRFEEYECADTKTDYMDKSLNKKDRSIIKQEIVAAIKESGGRFLKQEKTSGVWVEVSEDVVMKRLVDEFKRIRKQRKAFKSPPTSPSPPITNLNQLLSQGKSGPVGPSECTGDVSAASIRSAFVAPSFVGHRTQPNVQQAPLQAPVLCQPEHELHSIDYPLGSDNTDHPGKKAVRHRVGEWVDEYVEADQKSPRRLPGRATPLRSRQQIITDVLRMLNDTGGAVKRKGASGQWAVVSQREARQRIAYEFFRAIKRQPKIDQNLESEAGQTDVYGPNVTAPISKDPDDLSFESWIRKFRASSMEDDADEMPIAHRQQSHSRPDPAEPTTGAQDTPTVSFTASDVSLKPPSIGDDSSVRNDQGNISSFTAIFEDVLNIAGDGPRRVIDSFGDDFLGVKEFLAIFKQNPDNVLKEYGFVKCMHQKRMRGFSVWFETELKSRQTTLSRESWVPFFTKWLDEDCPSVSQLSQREERVGLGDEAAGQSINEDLSLMSTSQFSLSPSELAALLTDSPGRNGVGSLNFTVVFEALHIGPHDGPRHVIDTFGNDFSGVKRFLEAFNEDPHSVLKNYGFIKPLHQKRIRGFNVWFETEYRKGHNLHFDRETWLEFFARWVRDGCPSLTQSQLKPTSDRDKRTPSIAEEMSIMSTLP